MPFLTLVNVPGVTTGIDVNESTRQYLKSYAPSQRSHENCSSKIPYGRMTLDQYYYTTIPDSTERDHDQVLSRYLAWQEFRYFKDHGMKLTEVHEQSGKSIKIFAVDQLWLWIVDESMWTWPLPWKLSNFLTFQPWLLYRHHYHRHHERFRRLCRYRFRYTSFCGCKRGFSTGPVCALYDGMHLEDCDWTANAKCVCNGKRKAQAANGGLSWVDQTCGKITNFIAGLGIVANEVGRCRDGNVPEFCEFGCKRAFQHTAQAGNGKGVPSSLRDQGYQGRAQYAQLVDWNSKQGLETSSSTEVSSFSDASSGLSRNQGGSSWSRVGSGRGLSSKFLVLYKWPYPDIYRSTHFWNCGRSMLVIKMRNSDGNKQILPWSLPLLPLSS